MQLSLRLAEWRALWHWLARRGACFDLAVFFLGSLGKLETGIMGVDFSASVGSSPAFISMSAITSGMSE